MAEGTVRRSTSRENSPAGRPEPLGRSAAAVSDAFGGDMPRASDALVGGGRRQADVAAAAGSDQLDDLRRTALLRVDHRCDAAQEEDGDAVGDLHDVVHVVRNQHNAKTLVSEAAYEVEDLTCLRYAERRRRLVEEDDFAVPKHSFGDGDGLSLPTGQARDGLPDRRHRAHRQPGQRLPCLALHLTVGEEAEAADLATQEHVLRDVEIVGEGEVLVDELDAESGRGTWVAERYRLSLERDGAGVHAVDARDALHERRLPGAVVPHQGDDLAGIDGEVDVVEDVHWAEALVQPTDLKEWLSHRLPSCRWPDNTSIRPPCPRKVRSTVTGRPRW